MPALRFRALLNAAYAPDRPGDRMADARAERDRIRARAAARHKQDG